MKQYEDLRRNLAQAKLAESLESRQRGSQFIIADAANFPLVPAKPNRLRIILIGFVLGLGFGAATAFVVDSLNPKIWTQEELQTRLGVSVLVEIPEIVTESSLSTARKRRLAHVFLLVVLSGVYVAGLYAAYTKRTILLKQLDPVVNLVLERS
jgi:uncharacterized protein involved in exopolysaccharide biosynthesis